jgi:hypothetical protein
MRDSRDCIDRARVRRGMSLDDAVEVDRVLELMIDYSKQKTEGEWTREHPPMFRK